MIKNFILAGLFCFSLVSFGQDYIPKNDGIKTNTSNYTVFTNAKLFVTPTQVIENGTLVIKDGKVVSSGKNVTIPKNSIIEDLKGKYIYPSFIDIYSEFGIKDVASAKRSDNPQYDASRKGYY